VELAGRGDGASERTVATARTVDGADRVAELSRMLAGLGTSQRAREHAAELLAGSQKASRA
jgi:DNA repair protein RecN (Recombination protein N)